MTKSPHMQHRYERIETAQDYLAECLKEGTLALALGAGISAGMGLPKWPNLVNSCCKEVGIKNKFNKNTANEKLLRAMNAVEDAINKDIQGNPKKQFDDEYRKLIHKCLYRDGKVEYDDSIIKLPLLIAIGALISGSARGSVKEIVTLNFDDVLEWYLSVYGLKTQIAHKLPVLRGNPDVIIYHLHGYIPKNSNPSLKSKIIFSKRSYDRYHAKDRLNLQQSVWIDHLSSKVVLFIGLSGNDTTFGPIFSNVKVRLKSYSPFDGPNNIWLMSPKTSKEIKDEIRDDWGGAPVIMEHKDYPSFILGICQRALKK